MANFNDNFYTSGNLDNWTISGPRNWFLSGDLLMPEDTASLSGTIVYDTSASVNGVLTIEYDTLDLFNGIENVIIFRYQNDEQFYGIKIDPGQDDNRGVTFTRDSVESTNPNDTIVTLYNVSGNPISSELSPNKTVIPQTGKVEISMSANDFDIVLRTSADEFVASGTHSDSTYSSVVSSQIGFGHSDSYNVNIEGWESIDWVDSEIAHTEYYLNTSGSNTAPYDTPEKGAPNLYTLISGVALVNGDIINLVASGGDIEEVYTSAFSYDDVIDTSITIKSYDGNTEKPLWRIYANVSLSGDACSDTSFYNIKVDSIDYNIFNFISNVDGLTVSGCEFSNAQNYPLFFIDDQFYDINGWVDCNNFIFHDNVVTDVSSIIGFGGNVSNVEITGITATNVASVTNQFWNNTSPAPVSAYPITYDNVYIGYNNFGISAGPYLYKVFDHAPDSDFYYSNYTIEHNIISGSMDICFWMTSNSTGMSAFNFSNNYISGTSDFNLLSVNPSSNAGFYDISINDNYIDGGTLSPHFPSSAIDNYSISGNTIIGGQYGGMFLQFANDNNTNINISDNKILSADSGIVITKYSGLTYGLSGVNIDRNIFRNCGTGITIDGFGASVDGDLSISYNDFDNTTTASDLLSVTVSSGGELLDVRSVNNIFSSPSATIEYNGVSATFDNNLYNTSALSLTLETGASSGDSNVSGDPLWIDSTNLNYNLSPISPAINTGYYGDDIGAIQYAEGEIIVTLSANTPICSGSDFVLSWETSGATSAFIDNGHGWVDTSGSLITSAVSMTIYSISAYNDSGSMSSASFLAQIYNSTPIADAGSNISVTATDVSGVDVLLDGGGSSDPQEQTLTYQWLLGSTEISTSESFTYTFPTPTSAHTLTLNVINGCGNSATDTVDVNIVSLVPPVASATTDSAFVNLSTSFILDGSNSFATNADISNYVWELSGSTISAGSVAAETEVTSAGTYVYTLTVYDTSGLSDTDTVSVIADGVYSPSADAGADQHYCVSGGGETTSACELQDEPNDPDIIRDTIDDPDIIRDDDNPICALGAGEIIEIVLDGSNSVNPTLGDYDIVWFNWDLSEFGYLDVSGTIENLYEISASFLASEGNYTATLTVSANNGLISTDTINIDLDHRPTASAGDDQNITVPCSGSTLADVTFSGTSDTSGAIYNWTFGTLTVQGNPLVRSMYVGEHVVTLNVTNSATGCVSDPDTINVVLSSYPLSINRFEFDPSYIQGSSAFATTTLYWETSGATSAFIDNGIGWVDISAVSAGNTLVSATSNITYNISAYDDSGCERTAIANAFISLGSISACKVKSDYVNLFGPEEIRYGECREINLTNFLPEYLTDSDTKSITEIFEDYLNQMYVGDCGYRLDSESLDVTACDVSSCSFSAINNDYSFDTYTSASVSSTIVSTPTSNVEKIFITNTCYDACSGTSGISILEKIYRLTELFDPDLIPIDLIQFYAENLGYNVGLNRENIGVDFAGTSEEINQRKYLRFMVRNLPTWYTVKTTRNSIRMMLYTFGLIGDFIYYFTSDYLDPNTSVTDIDKELEGLIITDGMTYKEIHEIKCNVAGILKLKNDMIKYKETIQQLQMGVNKNWELTSFNPVSTKEDITTIPDDFFSSPHFRLWFDIDASLGNFSFEIEKQRAIRDAVMAVKPINTVFEGVTGYIQRIVNMYVQPYVRIRGHIKLHSDGYADNWNG